MANNLITLDKAREEIKRLQLYVRLIETYKDDTLEKKIIKLYATYNSFEEVLWRLREDPPFYYVDSDYLRQVIKSKPRYRDDLHKIVRRGYMIRTKSHRARKGLRERVEM